MIETSSTKVANTSPLPLKTLDKQPLALPKEITSQIFADLEPVLLERSETHRLWHDNNHISKNQIKCLDKAHQLTRQLYGVFRVSQTSKSFYETLNFVIVELRNEIARILADLHTSNDEDGIDCLRECVESGFYLNALRIYFFCNPQALWNGALDATRRFSFKRTILHNAVAPDYYLYSKSFVEFILKINKAHNLGLTNHKDFQGETPLERARNAVVINYKKIIVPNNKEIPLLLEAATEEFKPVALPK